MRRLYFLTAEKLNNYLWGRALVAHFTRHQVFYENFEALYIALILALFIKGFLFEAYKIPSASMHDTLLEGDRIFVNKMIYNIWDVQVGDVVVFKTEGIAPIDQPDKPYYIKRVVGLPGDIIEIRDGYLFRNGKKTETPHFFVENYYTMLDNFKRVFEVPPGQVYVFGDNSFNSYDSRAWGGVPIKNLMGKAFFRFYPFDRLGRINGVPPTRASIRRGLDFGENRQAEAKQG